MIERSAMSRFVGVGDILTEIIDADTHPRLVHRLGSGDRFMDCHTGNKSSGNSVPNGGTFCKIA